MKIVLTVSLLFVNQDIFKPIKFVIKAIPLHLRGKSTQMQDEFNSYISRVVIFFTDRVWIVIVNFLHFPTNRIAWLVVVI